MNTPPKALLKTWFDMLQLEDYPESQKIAMDNIVKCFPTIKNAMDYLEENE